VAENADDFRKLAASVDLCHLLRAWRRNGSWSS
jgi:hypothetical protein